MTQIFEPTPLESQLYRHELKYLVHLGKGRELMEELKHHCKLDKHVDETESYEISSIYYDTSDLRFYVDREESVGYRRKVRFRSYNKDGKSKALFVEIKERHKNLISKKRVNLKESNILEECQPHNRIPLDRVIADLEDGSDAREIAYLHKRLELEPIVMIRYMRMPLIPIYEDKIRITLDTQITAGGHNLTKRDPDMKVEKFILNADYGIFEVKTNDVIPMWLQSVLLRYGLSQTRFSKYCLGVDAVYGPHKPWLRTSADVAVEVSQSFSKKVA